jgi:hypothetical protein
MAKNLPTYFVDSTLVTAREAELPSADFTGGMNKGASNAPGTGVNTGDYSPKDSDWPEAEQVLDSQAIGQAQSGVFCEDATFGDTALVGFAPPDPDADVDPDDPINIDVDGSGFANVNRTGKVVPAGAWTWGAINNP